MIKVPELMKPLLNSEEDAIIITSAAKHPQTQPKPPESNPQKPENAVVNVVGNRFSPPSRIQSNATVTLRDLVVTKQPSDNQHL